MSAPLLEADSLGFVDNLYCRDSGVICDRLEGQIEFTLCGWLHLRPPEGQTCAFSYRCADHQWEFPGFLYRSGRQHPPPAPPRNPPALARKAPRFCHKPSLECGALRSEDHTSEFES